MNLRNFLFGVAFIVMLFFFVPIRIYKSSPSDDLEEQFDKYLEQYNKSYDNATVYQRRFKAFQESLKAVRKLNLHRKHNRSAYYGLTKFSDMTPDEFLDKHLQSDLYNRMRSRGLDDSDEYDGEQHHTIHSRSIKKKLSKLPEKVDWREKGVVTKVNSQKLCGACWAFSTVENMETMYAIKHGQLKQLSVQQVIDCAKYNDGCDGGDSCSLLHWLKNFNVTVYDEQEYPLHWKNEQCKVLSNYGVQVDRFACDKLVGNEDYILRTLAHIGPVAVAINALTWQYYIGGVVQFHCSGSPKLLNHAVQIVGYDLSANIPHYIVRNSWGEDFGENGYLYIGIGENLCGLANEVSVLTVL